MKKTKFTPEAEIKHIVASSEIKLSQDWVGMARSSWGKVCVCVCVCVCSRGKLCMCVHARMSIETKCQAHILARHQAVFKLLFQKSVTRGHRSWGLFFLIPLNIHKIILFQKSFPLRYRFCVQDRVFSKTPGCFGDPLWCAPAWHHLSSLWKHPLWAGFFSDLSSCRVSGQWSCNNYLAME